MSLNDSPLGLRRDLGLVNVSFVPSAGDEIPGMRAGGRPRLRIPALVSDVNYVFSRAFPSGGLVMIGVDVVFLAHNYSSGKCPTSFQLVDVFLSRPQPEVSTSWKLVGHCAARFSFFQGAATGMAAPAENCS